MKKKIVLLSIMTCVALSCKKEITNQVSQDQMDSLMMQPVKTASHQENPQDLLPPPPADGKYPVITFKEIEHDFGTIKQGDKVEHTFEFTNTGEADLILVDAKASCGCTVPEYTKNTPIKPGEKGKIKVSFDSKGKSGDTQKSVTITCNTKEMTELIKIKVNIKE